MNKTTIDRCSSCGVPAHASETDDLGRCQKCMFGPPTAYPCLVKLVATTGDPCWHQLSPSDRALYQEESYVR